MPILDNTLYPGSILSLLHNIKIIHLASLRIQFVTTVAGNYTIINQSDLCDDVYNGMDNTPSRSIDQKKYRREQTLDTRAVP